MDNEHGDPNPQDESVDLSEEFGGQQTDLNQQDPPADADTPDIVAAREKARADALADENSRLIAAQRTAPQAPPPAVAPARRALADELVTDEFIDEFARDAKGAFHKLVSGVEQGVRAELAGAQSPGAINQGISLTDSFKARKRDENPEQFAVAIKAFNERLQTIKSQTPESFAQLAAMSPEACEAALNAEWLRAYGTGALAAEEARRTEAGRQRPAAPSPGLSGGRGGGGGGVTPQKRTAALSQFEQDLVRRAKASGLSQRDCERMVMQDRQRRREVGA